MSPSLKPPPAPTSTWSALLADRYHCRLSPVLADWFDNGPWNGSGSGEYCEPVSPELLLTSAPEAIWPGLMCCDLLPLLGSPAGDWLCARVDRNNVLSEIVQWYHGGGDWIPWGNDLAEAVLFDAALGASPHLIRRHAVPAENPRPAADAARRRGDPILRWAQSHHSNEATRILEGNLSSQDIAQELIQAGIAQIAVRCDLVVSLLTHWPREVFSRLFRHDQDLDRSQIARWSFDLDLMPSHCRDELQKATGIAATQDWETAAELAAHVCLRAPDQAWAWDVCGYAAERRGDMQAAIDSYHQSSQCSVFTDQSIRLDTHWTANESAKFSVARLKQHRPEEIAGSDYYQILCLPEIRQRRLQATRYWTEQATLHTQQSAHAEAHRCFMSAAWDLGAEPMSSFAMLIENIANSAESAGQVGRAELARTHRRCLQERYGI